MDIELKAGRHHDASQHDGNDCRIEKRILLRDLIERQQYPNEPADRETVYAYLIKVSGDCTDQSQRINNDEELQKIVVQTDPCSAIEEVGDDNVKNGYKREWNNSFMTIHHGKRPYRSESLKNANVQCWKKEGHTKNQKYEIHLPLFFQRIQRNWKHEG